METKKQFLFNWPLRRPIMETGEFMAMMLCSAGEVGGAE